MVLDALILAWPLGVHLSVVHNPCKLPDASLLTASLCIESFFALDLPKSPQISLRYPIENDRNV